MTTPADILLVAINARYSHCSYAVRSLQANLGALSASSALLETDLDIQPFQLASQIAARRPRVVSFTAYLWNIRIIENTAQILRTIAPNIRLSIGGPEITPDYARPELFDALTVGEGETTLRDLCERWLKKAGPTDGEPLWHPPTILTPDPEDTARLELPYALYTDTDLTQRTIYVEASRGCPYRCTYCTSADTGLRLIPLDRLLPALDVLWQRGLRRFKFLDRTFNAPEKHASDILDFFLARITHDTRLHFEINPDHLNAAFAAKIATFPQNTLHLETGVQTLNPRVAGLIGRSADTATTLANMRFLTHDTRATVHADLIFGLPGEDEASFAHGFNALVTACNPPEVQVNLLKVLPGTRLARDAERLGLAFNREPPYEVLRSDTLDFASLTGIQCFARCWELVHNRNRFPHAVQALHAACNGEYYWSYKTLASRIQNEEGKFFAISLPHLARHLRDHLIVTVGISEAEADRLIEADLNGAKP